MRHWLGWQDCLPTEACCSRYSKQQATSESFAGCPVLQHMLQTCAARLIALTENMPQEPKDWAVDGRVECKHSGGSSPDEQCTLCIQFQAFLNDASQPAFSITLSRRDASHVSRSVKSKLVLHFNRARAGLSCTEIADVKVATCLARQCQSMSCSGCINALLPSAKRVLQKTHGSTYIVG